MTLLETWLARPDIVRLTSALAARPGRQIVPEVGMREAAIALVLRPASAIGEPELLMIRRAELASDPWSGHIACPGGQRDPVDRDLERTAIRETWEETGIDLARDGRILGTLDDVSPRTPVLPSILIRPFVAAVRPGLALTRSQEVAEAFWVPLTALRARAAWGVGVVSARGTELEVEVFRHGAYIVWGLTERVLRQFLTYLDAA